MFEKWRGRVARKMTVPHRWFYALTLMAVLDAIDAGEYLCRAISALAHNWETKSTVASAVAVTVDSIYAQLTGVYGTITTAYFWVISLDIATRWLAAGNQYLLLHDIPQDRITTIDKVQAILLAFNDGRLTSRLMIGGFISKFVLFGVGIATAYHLDRMFHAMDLHLPLTVMTFVLGYFCYHEAISIAENLRDAGNQHMDKLVELLNTNLYNKLKK